MPVFYVHMPVWLALVDGNQSNKKIECWWGRTLPTMDYSSYHEENCVMPAFKRTIDYRICACEQRWSGCRQRPIVCLVNDDSTVCMKDWLFEQQFLQRDLQNTERHMRRSETRQQDVSNNAAGLTYSQRWRVRHLSRHCINYTRHPEAEIKTTTDVSMTWRHFIINVPVSPNTWRFTALTFANRSLKIQTRQR